MSLTVIELNDSAVTVSDESGVILQSPGFALASDQGLEVGHVAKSQARIKPTSSFNNFWHQLSLEPLNYSVGNIRHTADLAYAHLMHLAEQASLDGDVIFAVPGNFTNQQLSILLGLAGQCPFNPIGIVDSALASVVSHAAESPIIYVDAQLHQTLLTRLSMKDGRLQREAVIQIPEVGLQHFSDLVMQLATGLFIQQCRFNPQHNAESEQLLCNEIPAWLQQHTDAKGSLLMELKTTGAIYQAKLPWESLVQKLANQYSKIDKQIAALAGNDNCQFLISNSLAELPEFVNSIHPQSDQRQVKIITTENLGKNCIELKDHITSESDGLHLVTHIPFVKTQSSFRADAGETASFEQKSKDSNTPTHVLFESYALPVSRVAITNSPDSESAEVNGSSIALAIGGLPQYLGQIEQVDGKIYIVCGEAGAIVNGEQVKGKRSLQLGDRIKFENDGRDLSMIRVRNDVS